MRIIAAIELFFFYLYEVIVSNLWVAYDVLTPKHHMTPEMVYVNVSGLTDRQLLAASNLITMTPGTLSLDVSDDRKLLEVHCMYAKDVEEMARDMEKSYLRRIRRVF